MKISDKERYLNYLSDMTKNMKILLRFEKYNVSDISDIEQLAIERAFEIIGEASKRLANSSFYEKYPEVEWSAMAKNRDFVSHHYDYMETKVSLRIIKESIPKNLILITKIIEVESATK